MSTVDLTNLIRSKVRSLKAYQVENIDCEIKLHANENPYPPPPELLNRFRDALGQFEFNRYPDPDSSALKKALSARTHVPVENLLIGNGSDELIQLLLQVFCDQGDTVLFPDPTFAMYSIIARGMGLQPETIPLDDQWDFTGEGFIQAIEQHQPRIVFISYPNNPTGNCFSEDAIRQIIEEFQGIVVVDEAYYDFSQKSFIEKIGHHNNLVILRSLSKIGLAALRVGFAAADPLIIEQMNKIRLPYNSNTVSQVFAEQMITHFSMVQKQIDTILNERDRLIAALSKMEAITVFPSDSNFVLFRVEHEGEEFFRKLIKNGILIRNLSSHPRLHNCLRVTVGTPEENDRFLAHTATCVTADSGTTTGKH